MEHTSYSERNKPIEATLFIYDHIPKKLRNQIYIIVDTTLGHDLYVGDDIIDGLYQRAIWAPFELQHGKLDSFHYTITYRYRVLESLKSEMDLNEYLDLLEYCFRFISKISKVPDYHMSKRNATMEPLKAIEELNNRFKQNSVGYQFADDMIIKMSNQLAHNEITVPVVNLLNDNRFANANEEYMRAQQHYKNGLNKECLNECLKAVESTLKIIFTQKAWSYNPNATLSDLISTAYSNELIPTYLQTQLGAIRTVLTSGVNTIRNKVGGHGQGAVVTTADDETTRFTLNLTGSYIIYLIELSRL